MKMANFSMMCSAEKMRAGTPLTDSDRWPWLQMLARLIAQHLSSGKRIAIACSALKETYRDVLRGSHADSIRFVSLLFCFSKI